MIGADDRVLVVVPAHPRAGTIEFEVRQLPDGSAVLPVFATVSGLVEEFGHRQPWVRVPLGAARRAAASAGVAQVAIDPPLAPGAWRYR